MPILLRNLICNVYIFDRHFYICFYKYQVVVRICVYVIIKIRVCINSVIECVILIRNIINLIRTYLLKFKPPEVC